MGHWTDADELELEYHVEGEVEDPRVDDGHWEGGLFSDSGSGETPERVWAKIKAQYESELG